MTQPDHSPPRGQRAGPLAGALAALTLLGLITAIGARHVPSDTPLGPLARMVDSLAPWVLAGSLAGALGTALAGVRRAGAVLALIALVGGGAILFDHRALSLPLVPEADADLRVIFFNVKRENSASADRIVTAALAQAPDVVVFAEAEALLDALPKLRESYEIVTSCEVDSCELVVATRLPVARAWQLTLNPIWDGRYGVAELSLPGGKRVFLSVAHLVKPWFSGVSEEEIGKLAAQYDWFEGPVIAVGDFNAAPWSRQVRALLAATGFRAVRRPPGTWPVRAGRWGVPIDLALVRGGVRITAIAPFGDTLGSNHRGLVIDVQVPEGE